MFRLRLKTDLLIPNTTFLASVVLLKTAVRRDGAIKIVVLHTSENWVNESGLELRETLYSVSFKRIDDL